MNPTAKYRQVTVLCAREARSLKEGVSKREGRTRVGSTRVQLFSKAAEKNAEPRAEMSQTARMRGVP